MVNIIIVHGTAGSPEGNWFPWIKENLEGLGHHVFVPRFPTPKNHSFENWMSVFDDYKKYMDKDSIVIGHSLGPAFLLNVLEKADVQISSAFFVAGFTGFLGNDYDKLNKKFVAKDFHWENIRSSCKRFYVINSDDDPYVPIEKGEELADNLGTELITVKGAGHINSEFGYDRFEFLLELIKKELQE